MGKLMAWERYLNLSTLVEKDEQLLRTAESQNARFLAALLATYPHLKGADHAR